jgi:hypothetical protein
VIPGLDGDVVSMLTPLPLGLGGVIIRTSLSMPAVGVDFITLQLGPI